MRQQQRLEAPRPSSFHNSVHEEAILKRLGVMVRGQFGVLKALLGRSRSRAQPVLLERWNPNAFLLLLEGGGCLLVVVQEHVCASRVLFENDVQAAWE